MPQRPEMLRKQESRGISMQELAFAQSPGFSGQQTQGPGDKARTLEGTSSLCKQKKVPVLQRERMIKGSHAYLIFGWTEKKPKQVSLGIPNHRPTFKQVWELAWKNPKPKILSVSDGVLSDTEQKQMQTVSRKMHFKPRSQNFSQVCSKENELTAINCYTSSVSEKQRSKQ